jgi:hypothetical protein
VGVAVPLNPVVVAVPLSPLSVAALLCPLSVVIPLCSLRVSVLVSRRLLRRMLRPHVRGWRLVELPLAGCPGIAGRFLTALGNGTGAPRHGMTERRGRRGRPAVIGVRNRGDPITR